MTTRTPNSIHFTLSKSHGWKDALVVSFLAIVLGAFVAEIASVPRSATGPAPIASVSVPGAGAS
jgi:hypothetical protein